MSDTNGWVDVLLARVVLHDESDQQNLYLRERGGQRGFAILVGTSEAAEIQRVLAKVDVQRPLTHQLLHEAVTALGGTLIEVRIVALKQCTYFARLVLRRTDGTNAEVDSRPSDAIALALRARCPIRVAGAVMRDAAS